MHANFLTKAIMSEKSTPHEHDAHAMPAHSLTKKLVSIAVLGGLPLVVVLGMVGAYKAQDQAAEASMSEQAVMARIQKVGSVSLGQAQQVLRTGEEVYKVQCTTCHAAALLGAPKFGDTTAWAPRIKNSYEVLLTSALKGKGSMTPQGGGVFSDYEIGRAVVYMVNAAGARFAEPKAPSNGASAPAAQNPASTTR